MPRGTMGPKLGVRAATPLPGLPASPPSTGRFPTHRQRPLGPPCLSLLTHSPAPFLGPCPASPPSTPRLTCLV